MNKLLTTIVGAALGATMTIGVGVAVANNASKEAAPVYAAESFSFSGGTTSGSGANLTITWSDSNLQIYQEKNTSTNDVNSSYVSQPRWYVGHKITFTPLNGAEITKVTFTATGSSYKLQTSSTFNNATATISGNVTTITPTNGASAFSVVVAGAQARPSTLTYEIASGGSDPFEPEHAGTNTDPYTVADARGCIDAGSGIEGVYAVGIIKSIPYSYTEANGVTFNMVDNYSDSDFLQAYKCTGAYASEVQIGDTVKVTGNLTKFNSTYEFTQGCTVISRTPKTVSSISVKTAPSKTVYYAGDYFDPTGLVITAVSNIGSEDIAYADHSSDFSFSPATNVALSTSNTSVTITYGGQTANQAITVNQARTMTSISLHGTISKANYYVGDTWDLSGLDIQVNWSTGDPTYVDFDDENVVYECSPATATGTSITSFDVEILYESFDETFTVNGITVSATPSYVTFDLSTDETTTATTSEMSWDNNYLTVLADKHNATTNTNNYYPGTSGQSYTSTRFYKDSKLTFTPKTNVEIVQVVYTATTSNYATALGSSTWTNATAVAKTDAAPFTVTITPTDGTTAFYAIVGATTGATSIEITYYATELTEITWAGTPVSPQYVGDDFDYTGLTFTAHYSDSSTAIIPGSAFSWEPLTAGHNPVGTYGGEAVSISGVSVIYNLLESIAISGDMTKTEYAVGTEWDPSGLIVTATFSKGPQVVTGEVEWSFSPSAPAADTESVVATASYTSGGVTKTASTSSIAITITETEGLLKSGYYYITATNTDVYYFPQGEYTGGSAANSPHATAYDSDVYGTPYYFNLISNNTYTISFVNSSSKTCYLNVANDNTGAKVTELDSITDACKWTLSANGTGHYKLVANDGTQDRYLALYNTQDWRTYKTTSTSGINVLDIISENDKFANDFKDAYTSSCNASGSYTSLDWTKAKNHFDSLNDNSEFISAQYTKSGTGAQTVVTKSGSTRQLVAEAVAKYDYIVGKYGTSVFADFMSRNPTPLSGAIVSPMNVVQNEAVITTIIVLSLLSFTTIGGYFLLRKKKED